MISSTIIPSPVGIHRNEPSSTESKPCLVNSSFNLFIVSIEIPTYLCLHYLILEYLTHKVCHETYMVPYQKEINYLNKRYVRPKCQHEV